jgi:hypothetical protein
MRSVSVCCTAVKACRGQHSDGELVMPYVSVVVMWLGIHCAARLRRL